MIENWHGVEFGNPLCRTRETIDIVKRVLSGAEVSDDGEYFELGGFRLRCEPPDPVAPVEAAGMGPKAVSVSFPRGAEIDRIETTVRALAPA